MKNYDCIFLDRDGTLNHDPGYINHINNFELFDFTVSVLQKLSELGNQFCIVTNQSGVSRGIIKLEDLDVIHNYINKKFIDNSINLLDIYICTDHPDQATERRKPGPGMFLEAESDHGLNLKNCLMIGDSIVDMEAGELLGMDTMLVLTGKGNETLDLITTNRMPTYVVKSLEGSVAKLCR